MDEILKFMGQVFLVGGGAAGLSLALFKVLGERWVETQFKRSLERHKYNLNSLYNRVTKIHEKEFEVLPIAWQKLLDAYGKIVAATFPIQSYDDVNRMSPDEFAYFLSITKLNELQKKKLSDSEDRSKYYQEVIKWQKVNECRQAISEFHRHILYNKIFLNAELFQKFDEVDKILSEAVSYSEEGLEANNYSQITKAYKMLDKKVEAIISDIEKLVQERLHYYDAT